MVVAFIVAQLALSLIGSSTTLDGGKSAAFSPPRC
jgi:hypothetical protein